MVDTKLRDVALKLGYSNEFAELLCDKDKQVQIRDSSGNVFNTLEHPVEVVDDIDGELVLFKIGEPSEMLVYYDILREAIPSANIKMVEIPRNQEMIDMLFNNTGYINKFYKAIQRIGGVYQ